MRIHALTRVKPTSPPQPASPITEQSQSVLDHRQLRLMLQESGLKTSMPRLKVLEMLCLASLDGSDIRSRVLRERLVDAGDPLSLVSVRQVLGRMVDSGLVVAQGSGRYRLAPAWEAAISAQRPRSSSAA